MKKRIFFIILFICTIAGLAFSAKSQQIEIEEDSRKQPENLEKQPFHKELIHQGNLLLIKKNHPIQKESIKKDIQTFQIGDLQGIGMLSETLKLSLSVSQKFTAMIKAAEIDGVDQFIITSGYRGIEEQSRLFEEKGSDYALPGGSSEHNSGLSLDVGSAEGEMATAPEGKWIRDNAWKHGFVLRYPENKTQITGIQYEPWHVRYIGLPHSALMYEKDFVLEEYLAYLKEKKELYASYKGKSYLITYYPYEEDGQLDIPVNQAYQISGDNVSGVIVTIEL